MLWVRCIEACCINISIFRIFSFSYFFSSSSSSAIYFKWQFKRCITWSENDFGWNYFLNKSFKLQPASKVFDNVTIFSREFSIPIVCRIMNNTKFLPAIKVSLEMSNRFNQLNEEKISVKTHLNSFNFSIKFIILFWKIVKLWAKTKRFMHFYFSH